MTDKPSVVTPTPFGFRYGPAEVTRVYHDDYRGYVMEVCTEREAVQIRVTPGGLIRLEPVKKILKPKKKKKNERAPDHD